MRGTREYSNTPCRYFTATLLFATKCSSCTHNWCNQISHRSCDGDGNIRSWWSETTSMRLMSSILSINMLVVDGMLTLNEIALAWDAYRNYVTDIQSTTNDIRGEEGDRLFFLFYAMSMCTKTREEAAIRLLSIDLHALSQLRVNGVVMNNRDFAKVFHCKPKTPMNPIRKCRIW